MTLTRAVFSALLVAVGPLWAVASGPIPSSSAKETADATATAPAQLNAPALEVPGALKPRVIFAKPKAHELVAPADWTGRLVVKFTDNVRARAGNDGSVRSVANQDLRAADEAVRNLGLAFKPAIRLPQNKIDELQARATAISQKQQPDLSGMMYIESPKGMDKATMERAARSLIDMNVVEWVEFEPIYDVNPDCEDEPDCGDRCVGDCFECHDPMDFPSSGGRLCDDPECCAIVCAIDPFCCDEDAGFQPGRGAPHWDAPCVAIALAFCPTSPVQNGVCDLPGHETCFAQHQGAACAPPGCCHTVCAIDMFCCQSTWDVSCVNLANELCPVPPLGAPTPSFTGAQGYLTNLTYAEQPGGVIGNPCPNPIPGEPPFPFFGFDGTGMDLHALWQFGNELVNQYGLGEQNLTRGKTIKVAVIEHTAMVDWQNNNNPLTVHEELRGKVIAEPGQTLIFGPTAALNGNHGTACLGIIGAKDQGTEGHSLAAVAPDSDEVGIVGIAPDADLYFFPIVSAEEGGRTLSAIASALTVFGPGDVLSFSIGGGGTTLAGGQGAWTMLRLAADLGVTCVIAAGNDCSNIDGTAQFQGEDSDVIIVGAVSPGRPFYRLGFSNFCRECAGANKVHISAWGTAVTTLGYGVLWSDGTEVRSYTDSFGGTSAATPQIAGLCANLQGFAKQLRGIPLTPLQLRTAIMTAQPCVSVATPGYAQAGYCGVTPPGNDMNPCGGDFDPDAETNWVADPETRLAYPIPMSGAQDIIQMPSGSQGNDFISDVLIIRGIYVLGNINSLRAVDGSYFIVKSLFTERRHRPNLPGPPGQVRYYGTGQTTDIMVTAIPTIPTDNMALRHVFNSPGPIGLMFLEMYDWVARRWMFIGIQSFAPGGGVVDGTFGVPAPQRFVNAHNNHVLIRAYGIAPGQTAVGFGASMEDGTFFMQHDMLQLIVGQTLPGVIFEFPL